MICIEKTTYISAVLTFNLYCQVLHLPSRLIDSNSIYSLSYAVLPPQCGRQWRAFGCKRGEQDLFTWLRPEVDCDGIQALTETFCQVLPEWSLYAGRSTVSLGDTTDGENWGFGWKCTFRVSSFSETALWNKTSQRFPSILTSISLSPVSPRIYLVHNTFSTPLTSVYQPEWLYSGRTQPYLVNCNMFQYSSYLLVIIIDTRWYMFNKLLDEA